MPNHVKNILRCKNVSQLDIYGIDDEGKRCVDFEKILPMPAVFKDTRSPVNDVALLTYNYITALNYEGGKFEVGKDKGLDLVFPGCNQLIKDAVAYLMQNYPQLLIYFDHKYVVKLFRDKTARVIEELYNEGERLTAFHEKHGYFSWYDWKVDNWGTKWNAYSFQEEGSDSISFWTAWNPPLKLYDKLFELYSDGSFVIKYADEQANGDAGIITYCEGAYEHEEYKPESQEALQTYIEVWGVDDYIGTNADGSYYYNEDGGCEPLF